MGRFILALTAVLVMTGALAGCYNKPPQEQAPASITR